MTCKIVSDYLYVESVNLCQRQLCAEFRRGSILQCNTVHLFNKADAS